MNRATTEINSVKFYFAAAVILLGCATAARVPAQEIVDADIVLTGGTLHRGDGQPPIVGDIAILDDRIVAVGEFEVGRVKQTIDCSGCIVSPGFIDLHNHSDDEVLDNETRSVMNYLTQGCTTIVTGNCGSGPTDVAEYYSTIEARGAGVNVAHLLPQGALRQEVLGTANRDADAQELEEMKRLAAKAMQDGAWGMSTGLIYVPSSYADTDELVAIAEVVAKHGGIYVSHIRGEGTELLDSVAEALEIGRRASLPVHISHFKSSGKDSWGLVRTAVAEIAKQRENGQVITADQYPYTASSTSLSATCIPAWARAGGREAMLERIDSDSDEAKQIRDAIRRKLELTDNGHRLQIAFYTPQPQWAGRRLDEIARDENLDTLDLVLAIERAGGASIVNHSINEQDVRFVMAQDWVATASDGSARIPSDEVPHPRSYGTFPRKIGFYAVQEKAIPLEQAVRSSTGLPADILGLSDRGYLEAGKIADVVVWKEAELIDRATFVEPHQYSDGIRYAFVNGTAAMIDGTPTGALAGRPLRHGADELE